VADAPWRCSQCGTVNEPVANACRTCGRWPSLFELEGSTIETDAARPSEEDPYAAQTVETEQLEPEVFEAEVDNTGVGDTDDAALPPEFETDAEEPEQPKPMWRRLASLVVPIGIVLYIIISAVVNQN
jgi:hypothetical protein